MGTRSAGGDAGDDSVHRGEDRLPEAAVAHGDVGEVGVAEDRGGVPTEVAALEHPAPRALDPVLEPATGAPPGRGDVGAPRMVGSSCGTANTTANGSPALRSFDVNCEIRSSCTCRSIG